MNMTSPQHIIMIITTSCYNGLTLIVGQTVSIIFILKKNLIYLMHRSASLALCQANHYVVLLPHTDLLQ